ncbi:MAG: hypothetical protein SV186_04350 [Candidatus Nanohaloarchaea archaeon]|nr:hypothetical protein [Candidatus Nanohaloarchaea archaeon]
MARTASVIVDQSVKAGDTSDHTAFAYSRAGRQDEDFERCVLMPKYQKQQFQQVCKNELDSMKLYRVKLFAAGVYCLTYAELQRLKDVIIDVEYENQGARIKGFLYNWWMDYGGFDRGELPDVRFELIRNYDPVRCHDLANEVRKHPSRADEETSKDFVFNLLLPSS